MRGITLEKEILLGLERERRVDERALINFVCALVCAGTKREPREILIRPTFLSIHVGLRVEKTQ